MTDLRALKDEELIDACIRRPINEPAWTEFWRRFYPVVLRRVRTALRPFGTPAPSDEQDIVQFVFLKIFQNLERFEPSKSPLEAYLSAIAKRTVIDELRKRRGRMQLDERKDVDELETAHSTTLDESRLSDAVAFVLTTLDPIRSNMLRAYLDGETTGAICDRFSVTRENLYTILSRFRKEIRKHLPELDAWLQGRH